MIKALLSSFKEFVEISFWRYKKLKEGKLTNSHYKHFYTDYFDLTDSFYEGKKVLDIGCGPRGSLEWADMTEERVGLDPLADKYIKMGASEHKMTYIKAYSEEIPFPDEYFDIICSFNSLDHVESVATTVSEIKRTLKKGAYFLVIVDIHNYPTPTEPQSLKWNFINEHFSDFKIIQQENLRANKAGRIYSNARNKIEADINKEPNGLLVAKLMKV